MTTSGPDPSSSRVPHVTRSGGRVQVGVGPGSWLVEGWSPGTAPPVAQTADLLRRLADGPLLHVPSPTARACTVSGEGALSVRLRRAVARATGSSPARVASGPAVGVASGTAVAGGPRPGGVVVLVGHYLVPVGSGRRADFEGHLLLPVVEQTGRVVVGPWVDPPDGPCLHCLDLHRRDRDAEWPVLAAQLEDPLTAPPPPLHPAEVLDVVEAVVLLLLRAAAGPARLDTEVCYEVGVRPPHIVTRRWTVHPGCRWHRPTA